MPKDCGRIHIKQRSCVLNLPNNVTSILHASCKDSTWSRYDSYLKKYEQFCVNSKYDPIVPSVNSVLSFLAKLYENGCSYSSINTARSALSSFFGKIEDVNLGEHPLVKQFLKGISKLRPPAPKYSTTWDVDQVLALFKSWDDNSHLSLYNLSVKLASLLALVSGQRVQTLHSIQILDIIVEPKQIRIFISKRLKTSGPNVDQPCIHLPRNHRIKKLCVASALLEYLDRTKPLRGEVQQLFISTRGPFKAVSSQTISHWLVKSLDLAKIDTSKYRSHSFRHASTSKAFKLGVKVSSIYKSAGWSKDSNVFYKFYNKAIDVRESDSTQFCKTILKSKK